MWLISTGSYERVIVSDHGSWENTAGRVPAPGGYGADAVPSSRRGTDGQPAAGPGAPAGRGALQRHQLAALPDRGLGPAPGRLGGADPVAGRPRGLAAVQPPPHASAGLRRPRITGPGRRPGPPPASGRRPGPGRPSSPAPAGWSSGCGAAGRAGAGGGPPPAP